jgi:hypothetical protein
MAGRLPRLDQVVHLVRSGRATAFRDGLPLDVFDRRKGHKRNFRGLYRLNAVETLSATDTFELVIVPVKHYALRQTLKEIVPRLGAAEFLLLTQNWRGTEEIDAFLPRSRYIYGDAIDPIRETDSLSKVHLRGLMKDMLYVEVIHLASRSWEIIPGFSAIRKLSSSLEALSLLWVSSRSPRRNTAVSNSAELN